MTNQEWEHLWIRCIQAHTTPDQYQKIKTAWEGRKKAPKPPKDDNPSQKQGDSSWDAAMAGALVGLIVG